MIYLMSAYSGNIENNISNLRASLKELYDIGGKSLLTRIYSPIVYGTALIKWTEKDLSDNIKDWRQADANMIDKSDYILIPNREETYSSVGCFYELLHILEKFRSLFRRKTDELCVTIEDIISSSAEYFMVSKEELLRKTNKHTYVKRRYMLYALCYQLGFSYTEIARACKTDHTNVIRGKKVVKENWKFLPKYIDEYGKLQFFILDKHFNSLKNIL